jgi:hypothetical protein
MRILSRSTTAVLALALATSAFANSDRGLIEHEVTEPQVVHQMAAPWVDEEGNLRSGGHCATKEYNPSQMLVMETEQMEALMSGRLKMRTDYNAPATIKVNWHIITDGSKGNVSATVITNTLDQLNRAFGGNEGGVNTGIQFVTNSVDTWNNKAWYAAKPGSRGEAEMKQTISAQAGNDPRTVLNIYTNSPGVYMGGTLLGWATFPWELASNPSMDGVVMNHIALDNGGTTSYNSGDVVAHEVGHWLGLYHTFQGGCTGSTGYDGTVGQGDLVSDTAPEASNASGCPAGRDTCAGGGVDPITNYMDYTSDACQTGFSAGQNQRLVLKSGLRSGL